MSLYPDNNNQENQEQTRPNFIIPDFSNMPRQGIMAGSVPTTQKEREPYVNPQPYTPPTPPDTLKLEYPALSSQIDQAISNGWTREQIRRYLGRRTELALTQYTPQEINKMLGRDENSITQLMQEMKRQNDNSYVQIMKYDMSENKVRDILNTSEYSGIAPSILLTHPELLPEAEKLAGERRGVIGQFIAAVRNNIANYNQSSAGAEFLDAQNIRNIMKDDNIMRDEGLRIWNAGLKTTLNPPPDDELIAMGRHSYEQRAQMYEEFANTDLQDSKRWATHVRPPDSVIGATLISAIENSGFTVMSSIKSLVGWTVGGWLGGLIASTLNTFDESQREAGEAFMEALKRGTNPEQAYNIARDVRNRNLMLLPTTNYLADWLVFGNFSNWSKLASRAISGQGILKSLGRGALTTLIPGAINSIPEGLEEYFQEFFKMAALGDKIDNNRLWDAAKMGFFDSMIYSLVGGGGRAALNRAINWHNTNKANKRAQEIQDVIQPVVDSIREIQDMSQQIQNGEIKPDDIVREEPIIFIPENRLDETTREKLDIQDEILEDENGKISKTIKKITSLNLNRNSKKLTRSLSENQRGTNSPLIIQIWPQVFRTLLESELKALLLLKN